MNWLDLFELRFLPFEAGSLPNQIIATIFGGVSSTIRPRWGYLSVGLILGAFLASWIQFRLVAPFALLMLIMNDWGAMDKKGWTLIMLLFGFQVFRVFMSGRW